ncbi:hypothetical protein [Nocardioides conyzicola]|uniref:Uncharacterized protein n=1 Tax=Nocardioides conyzicola TaxID=1651781 RepID=A0ABP8WUD6_9ACTN
MSKQLLLALGAGGAVTAAVVASAASIGSVNSTDLGAGTTVVASCDSSIDVDYTTSYDSTEGGYKVATITLSGLAAACIGQDVTVTVKGPGASSNASLDEVDGTVASDSGTPAAAVNLELTPSTTVMAADVTGLAVVISG